jgi:hypothetical protein
MHNFRGFIITKYILFSRNDSLRVFTLTPQVRSKHNNFTASNQKIWWHSVDLRYSTLSSSDALILKIYNDFMYKGSTKGRDSSVGIATGYGLDDGGVGVPSPGRVKNFLFSTSSSPALGSTQPPIQWVPGALSRG